MNKILKIQVGTKFGKWTIISDKTIKKNNVTNWKCQCKCGKKQFVPLNNLMNGLSTCCKDCSKIKTGKKRRTGFGKISGNMWSQFVSSSKKKNINVNIRIEEAWNLFILQEKKCAISGVDIHLSGYPYDRDKTSAILVRKNSSKDFTIGNSFWVHKDIALIIEKLGIEKFISYIYKVSETQKLNKWKEIL